MNRLALLISVVFHPLLMTTYLFVVISLYLPGFFQPVQPSIRFLFLIFLMTFLLPILNFIFFRVTGTIKDFSLFNRSDRLLPFAFVTILYCLVTFMFMWKFPVASVLRLMMIITAMIIVASVITIFFKVSVHAVAACGIVGILMPLNQLSEQGALLYPTVAALVAAGAVMSARLQLNAHSLREVWIGALTGFAIGFAGMQILF